MWKRDWAVSAPENICFGDKFLTIEQMFTKTWSNI